MPNTPFRKKRTNPFTLIELLVVVAIIAILAGMLMPSLIAARETARGINCVSNMKQLSLVYLYYSNDYNDYLPCLNNYGGQGALNSEGQSISPKTWLNDLVKTYLRRRDASANPVRVLFCPSELENTDITTNYGLNYLIATKDGAGGIKTLTHRNPAMTSMLVENYGHLCYYGGVKNATGKHASGSSYGLSRAAFFRHNNRAVASFLDSHVEQRQKSGVPCLEAYPDKSAAALENTYFNSGKVDSTQATVENL